MLVFLNGQSHLVDIDDVKISTPEVSNIRGMEIKQQPDDSVVISIVTKEWRGYRLIVDENGHLFVSTHQVQAGRTTWDPVQWQSADACGGILPNESGFEVFPMMPLPADSIE